MLDNPDKGGVEYVDVTYDRILTTDLASAVFLFEEGESTEYTKRLPLSQIEDGESLKATDEPGDVSVSRWLAEKEGLV